MIQLLVLLVIAFNPFSASSESYENKKGTLPSPVNYFNMPDNSQDRQPGSEDGKEKRDPRLGFQLGYGNDLQGYSGSGVVGTYTPLKIDLGGLVLGTVIGLGAVLIAPKLFHIFSPTTHPVGGGGYGRSANEGSGSEVFSSIQNVISRIDETLQEHEIDSLSCLQKAACTLVRSMNSSSTLEILGNSSNPIFSFLMDGSKLKAAMDRGLQGENCAKAYPHCSISGPSHIEDNRTQ